MTMTTIKQLIAQIEKRQPVLNKSMLSADSMSLNISGISSLDTAAPTELSFLANPKYAPCLANSQAAAVLITEQYVDSVPKATMGLVVASPYVAYASSSQLFAQESSGHIIHPTAIIADDALLEDEISIGAYCIIGSGVKIGKGSHIASHVVIEPHVSVGEYCFIKSQVTIGHDCVIGDRVRVHAGASIGAEGFGFAPTSDPSTKGWERIAQLGRVIIGDDTRIGSNTCIDRGAIHDTLIGKHVIIDNLVQIAHNVSIGDGTAIAAQTGIAGSTTLGKRCIVGGAVGITGHIDITDDVTLSAMTMVTKSIKTSGAYSSGTAAMPTANWRRAAVHFRQTGNK